MKLNYRRTFFIGLAFMSICAFWQLYDYVVPYILQYTFDLPEGISGIVMAADNLLALFLLPLFGSLTVKSASSSFARTFSTLMASGLPMLDALEITAKNMTNVYFEEALMQARSDVAAGTPLALPLEASGIFPPMVYHMTSIGEETGELEAMLTKMADYYDEEVESATAALTSAIEPLIMVFLAGIVLVVVLAIYLPMFTMYDGFL